MSFTEKADGVKRNFLLKYYVNFLVKLMVEKQRDTTEHDNKFIFINFKFNYIKNKMIINNNNNNIK